MIDCVSGTYRKSTANQYYSEITQVAHDVVFNKASSCLESNDVLDMDICSSLSPFYTQIEILHSILAPGTVCSR